MIGGKGVPPPNKGGGTRGGRLGKPPPPNVGGGVSGLAGGNGG